MVYEDSRCETFSIDELRKNKVYWKRFTDKYLEYVNGDAETPHQYKKTDAGFKELLAEVVSVTFETDRWGREWIDWENY